MRYGLEGGNCQVEAKVQHTSGRGESTGSLNRVPFLSQPLPFLRYFMRIAQAPTFRFLYTRGACLLERRRRRRRRRRGFICRRKRGVHDTESKQQSYNATSKKPKDLGKARPCPTSSFSRSSCCVAPATASRQHWRTLARHNRGRHRLEAEL